MLSSMDLPTTEVDLGPEKIEDEKEGGLPFHCDLCDTEVVHKVAQMFMPGLATACVDNTSGDLFRTPGSVAAGLRNEMTDYLTQRSESFVAESVILEGGPEAEVSDNPFDIISDFVDDFTSSKRNLFSRVSGWLLNDKREDKIDDFIQDMEKDGFWSLDKREAIAETLLKNVDFKCSFHCSMKFNSEEELANHVYNCSFRSMICENEGCDSRFCAANLEKHDAICPFKIIPCEQKCSDSIMRRAMDRHCITSCPMRLVNCPFYSVGCRVAIRQCDIEKHRSDELHSHLMCILRGFYRNTSDEDLKRRVEQIVQAESNSRLAGARDVRPLRNIVKEVEAKLGPFKVTPMKENSEEENAKKEGAEDGDTEKKGTEQTADLENSEESSIMNENTAKNNINSEDRDSQMKNESCEESTQNSNMENSSGNSDVTSIMNSNTAENNVNSEDRDSQMKNEGGEESIQNSKMENSSENSEVSSIMNSNTAENNVNIEDRDSQMKNEGEESTQYSNTENPSANSEVSSIMNSNTAENNVNSEERDSQMKKEGGEESAQNADMANSSNKPEVSAVNKDSAGTCKEKDAEDSNLEIKGNEESKQTKLADSL